MKRPLFIALEGIDGSGKSTQCRRLTECLQGKGLSVTACADPGGTPVGDKLRELLLHYRGNMELVTEALLFMASRSELVSKVIRPALDSGSAVLCDRFLLSNVAYQGYAGGLDPEMIWELGRIATGGLLPDLTIVLDLPVPEAANRRKRKLDRMESRDASFHESVRAGFLKESERNPERIKVVDASLPIDEVSVQVCDYLSAVFPRRLGVARCKH